MALFLSISYHCGLFGRVSGILARVSARPNGEMEVVREMLKSLESFFEEAVLS